MQFFRQHLQMIALLAPLVAFFAFGSFIDYESNVADGGVDGTAFLYLVMARAIVMGLLIVGFWRIYLKDFSFQVDHWGLIVGIIGGAAWIGLCAIGLEQKTLTLLGLAPDLLGERSGVNPWKVYADTGTRDLFLCFRFSLLVVTVPIAEELFLRGFFMRYIDATNWQELKLSEIGTAGLVAGTAYGVASHPSEIVAAAVWFSLVTWLMVRTDKFWNCVLAHAVTNLILGVYLCMTGNWHLW